MRKASEICFASLPEISRVEVVHLAPLQVQKNGIWLKARMEDAREAPCVSLQGEAARHIAQLWRELPPEKQGIRCHYPHFGVRFYRAELLELEASLCWRCHNIFGTSDEAGVSGEFDSEHPKSQELLALLQRIWKEKEQL